MIEKGKRMAKGEDECQSRMLDWLEGQVEEVTSTELPRMRGSYLLKRTTGDQCYECIPVCHKNWKTNVQTDVDDGNCDAHL